MRHVDYAVRSIQRAIAKVKNDRFTPATLSPQLSDYLIDLTIKHPADGSEFSKFVISLPHDAIEKEILRQILPANVKQLILDHRAQYEKLQIKKESEIAAHNFGNACAYRDQQEQLVKSVRKMIADQELVITPQLIDSALKTLGCNEF